jgi:DNA-binding HxlR family transcriptional regulator
MTAVAGKRSYGQVCPVARALDVLGERWTLLIVRELLLGPKRFKDLAQALPSIGANRLTERLRELEAHGVVAKRTLPPPGDVRAYVLTPYGERLRPVLLHLATWGADLPLAPELADAPPRAELLLIALAGTSAPEETAGLHETYEFHVSDEVFHAVVDDGVVTPRSGPVPYRPSAMITCSPAVFDALTSGALGLEEAVAAGKAVAEGEPEAVGRVFRVLRWRSEPAGRS